MDVIGKTNRSLIGFKVYSPAGNTYCVVRLGVMIEAFIGPGRIYHYYSVKKTQQ